MDEAMSNHKTGGRLDVVGISAVAWRWLVKPWEVNIWCKNSFLNLFPIFKWWARDNYPHVLIVLTCDLTLSGTSVEVNQFLSILSWAVHHSPGHNPRKVESKWHISPVHAGTHFPERLHPECCLQFQSSVLCLYLQWLKAKARPFSDVLNYEQCKNTLTQPVSNMLLIYIYMYLFSLGGNYILLHSFQQLKMEVCHKGKIIMMETSIYINIFLFFFCTKNWNQGLKNVRQALYHWTIYPNP